MKHELLTLPVSLVVGSLLSTTPVFGQGALTPPGAPAPTMLTLSQIEPRTPISSLPFTISSSGAYYVTANLTGVASANGITISADNVDLDLKNFTMTGVAGSLDGISVPASQTNITIHDGTLRSWGGFGLNASNVNNSFLEKLRSGGNASTGLIVGAGAALSRCEAVGNGLNGIIGGSSGHLTGCMAVSNAISGIVVSNDCSLNNCTANANKSATTYGMITGNNCKIIDCTVDANNLGGIRAWGLAAGANCLIKNCELVLNRAPAGGVGLIAGSNCNVVGCLVNSNSTGALTGYSSLVRGSTFDGNEYDGLTIGNGSFVFDNTASGNAAGTDLICSGQHITLIHNYFENSSLSAANNAIGTVETPASLNSNLNPHANFKPF